VPSQLGTFSGIALDSASQNVLRGNFVAHQPGGGIVLASTTTENRIIENTAVDNAPFDAEDDNPNCGTNVWRANQFDTVSQTCVR
jgi:parallel beta-helix repeat protein